MSTQNDMPEIRYVQHTGQHWLFIPAGFDAAGDPLTWARPATGFELHAWRTGGAAELVDVLHSTVPSLAVGRPRPWWRRLYAWVINRLPRG